MIIKTHRGTRLSLVAVLAAAALGLTACSSDSPPADEASPAAGGETTPAAETTAACNPADVVLIGQVRNETNPYEASWLDGGDAFADQVGLSQQRLTYDGESTKQQEQIRQVLASGDAACTVLNVLPNNDSDTTPIVEAAQDAGAWVITQWNKPADLNVADYDHWVAHITYDGVDAGRMTGEALFEAMGGSGNIIALQGVLDAAAAKDRFTGLEGALADNPDITLLDQQTANFTRADALTVTRTLLTKYGDQIDGIWTANDDMALGALQALEAAGLLGQIPVTGMDAVPEALQAIADGSMTATISADGMWQGAIGLAMGYCVATGELKVADIATRAFFAEQTLVTADNADAFITPTLSPSDFECANVFNRIAAPLP